MNAVNRESSGRVRITGPVDLSSLMIVDGEIDGHLADGVIDIDL